MSKFENIEPEDITISINAVTNRIVVRAWQGDEFHEIAFAEGKTLNLQEMIDALKEDLREQPNAK